MISLNNKNVCIIGAKRSGRALCDLVLKHQGHPRVSDKSYDDDFAKYARDKDIIYEKEGHTPEFIEKSDLIVLSPGVPVHSEVIQWAQDKNVPVLGEIEFAYQFCIKPVIAITGSNGKTTVSTLIHEALERHGQKSRLCGNIGTPFARYCMDDHVDVFVLELSSFQLESILDPGSPFRQETGNGRMCFKGFRPHIAALLNFSENHLDRHENLDEYFQAKARLFLNQTAEDIALLSEQNQRIKALASQLEARVVFFDDKKAQERFRTHNPNHLAVYQVLEQFKIPVEKVRETLTGFKGVEHRLEWVRNLGGVDYFNDSKATTAEAGRWALNNIDAPVVMICGGRDKNIDFSVIKELIGQKVRTMVVFGEAKEKLKKTFGDIIDVQEATDLSDAVLNAKKLSHSGDCVVLSPMCASFDMFSDYEQRGKAFKQIVSQLT